jgi:hypothetical protein
VVGAKARLSRSGSTSVELVGCAHFGERGNPGKRLAAMWVTESGSAVRSRRFSALGCCGPAGRIRAAWQLRWCPGSFDSVGQPEELKCARRLQGLRTVWLQQRAGSKCPVWCEPFGSAGCREGPHCLQWGTQWHFGWFIGACVGAEPNDKRAVAAVMWHGCQRG